MDPFGKTFLNNISLNVTGYMEISMDPFGKKVFEGYILIFEVRVHF